MTALFGLVRLALSATIPLSVDEAYAVVVSRSHSLSYFDHPPLGFALARLAADLCGSEARAAVRLPFVILGTLSTLLVFDLTRLAYGRAAAFWAAAWFSVSPFFLISAGGFVVPDGPLDFCLLASIRCIAPILFDRTADRPLLRWTGAGLFLALALMSKYQAALFAVSLLAVLLRIRPGRDSLRTPDPWLAAAVASLGLVPTVVWNAQHHWISIAFQGGRSVSRDGGWVHLANLGTVLLGQIAYLWPVVWFGAMAGIVKFAIARERNATDLVFVGLAIVPIVFFDLVAVTGSHSLPHWSMSGFLFAFPLVGRWFAGLVARRPIRTRNAYRVAAIGMPLLAFAFALQAGSAALTRPFSRQAGKFDVNWQLIDWSALATGPVGRDGVLSTARYIVAPSWMQAAKIGDAVSPSPPIDVFPGDPHHFQYIESALPPAGDDGVFVAALPVSREAAQEAAFKRQLSGTYQIAGPSRYIEQTISGFPVFKIVLLPVHRISHIPTP